MALVYDAQGRLVDDGTGPTRNPNAVNVGQAVGDVILGGLSAPGAALADLARYRATQALGGDTSTLAGGVNPRLDAAQQRIGQGLSQLGGAVTRQFEGVQASLLGALGAQPATAATPAPNAATTAAQAPTTAPTAATAAAPTTAPTPAPVPTTSTMQAAPETQPATTLSPDILAQTNAGIARTLAEARGPAPIAAERGNYNMANTSTVDAQGNISSTLRQPVNVIAGGYGGFGGGRGAAYLQQMAQQDAAQSAANQQRRREIAEDVERIGLRNALTRGTPQERRAARQALEALDQRAALRIQEGGATTRQEMQVAGEQARAQVAGTANVQAALARAAGAQQAAQIAGEFGLQRAETAALGRINAAEVSAQANAQSGTNLLAQQRARQLAIQEQLLLQAQEAGDISGTFAAAGLSRPPVQEYIDPLTGAPLTPEQVRILQQQALARLGQTQ